MPVAPANLEAGFVSVSTPQAAPAATIRVSGTCPTPPAGAAQPVVRSVTSPAFSGPESFSETDPMAFDGTATISRSATAGAHQRRRRSRSPGAPRRAVAIPPRPGVPGRSTTLQVTRAAET
ncbi:MAG: hypothetical protein ABS81_10565 [Pseudonocardia sp. SCN 72-86]|nr:MAG: hypothetical protein ABS81_10565 [Pseudonocardia sp. SCN 72-86]